jgi:hypothetical protein
MDFCVFKWSGAGTDQAHFADNFSRDIANRDFACNSVYYDPINEVLIDPLGYGISEAETGMLSIVADDVLRTPHQLAQVVVRFFKLTSRGMIASDSTLERVSRLVPNIAGMTHISRFRYVRSQVVLKNAGNEDAAYEEFRQSWINYGFGKEFDELIDCGRTVICGGIR